MPGGDLRSAHARSKIEKLIELDEVVAKRAGDRRAPVQIVVDERADHLFFEAILEVDDVIRNAQMLGDLACVVDIVQRAAAADGAAFGNQFRQAPLIPELHGQADDTKALAREQPGYDGAVHTARHGNGDCVVHRVRHWRYKSAKAFANARHIRRPHQSKHRPVLRCWNGRGRSADWRAPVRGAGPWPTGRGKAQRRRSSTPIRWRPRIP